MDYSSPGSSDHGMFQGKNTRVGCHFLLQGIFLTQGLNTGLLHCRQTLFFFLQADSLPTEPPRKTTNMGLSKLWEIVKDREAWHAAVPGFTKSQTKPGD